MLSCQSNKTRAAIFTLLLAGASATLLAQAPVAQQAPTLQQAQSACGDQNVKFKTKTNRKDHSLAPVVPGKAQVYIINDYQKIFGQIGSPTIRVGMDGAWLGANHGGSYLYAQVDPGPHHVCVSWQSVLPFYSKLRAFSGFNAEAGKAYYFRSLITPLGDDTNMYRLTLEKSDSDEAISLIAEYPHVTANSK